jgi:antitoxin CptB
MVILANQNLDVEERDDNRRRRLIFRSWHRGTREMDILMGSFADHVVPTLIPAQIDEFEALLECNDPDLYDWYTEKTPVPEADNSSVLVLFLGFKLPPKK